MGKAARNKRDRQHTSKAPSASMSPRDPSYPGTFAATGVPSRAHPKNLFFIYKQSDDDSYWMDLARVGEVRPTEASGQLIEDLLDHPLVASFRTESGCTMRQYIHGRRIEDSLDGKYAPALILLEFHSRALINGLFSVHKQVGGALDASIFDQVRSAVRARIAELVSPFPELDFREIEESAIQKARLCAKDVLLDEVAFRAAA
jgi:hypothetical protein